MLTDAELAAVRALEAEVVAHDGGRLKLELGMLETDRVTTALEWDGERLVGYVGRYAFGSPDEVAGMVAPSHRRRGIATRLLRQVVTGTALLVTPRQTPAGRAFAERLGGRLDHSEHLLALRGTPDTPEDPRVSVRAAGDGDDATVRRLLKAAFDWEPPADVVHRFGDTTRVVELDGEPVGTLRVSRRDGWAGVYGFAVEPGHQGRGIGRDVLARTCRELRADGVARVTLEVETLNASALGLYTSLGFEIEAGEDYWEVELSWVTSTASR